MVSMIVGLVALLSIGGLIIAGTRFSLYLFYLQNAEGTHSFAHPAPAADEQPRYSTAYNVERPTYAPVMSSESSSSRYALGSLMVIAVILVLAIMAVISFTGMLH